MTDIERYNKYYKGKSVTIPHKKNNISYSLGRYSKRTKSIFVSYICPVSKETFVSEHPLLSFFNKIDDGIWILNIVDDRKRKIKQILKKCES